jgi:hypothetical protein
MEPIHNFIDIIYIISIVGEFCIPLNINNGAQHNNTQHRDTQNDDTQYNGTR